MRLVLSFALCLAPTAAWGLGSAALDGDTLVVNRGDIDVYDVSDPAHPVLRGTQKVPWVTGFLTAGGGYAYVGTVGRCHSKAAGLLVLATKPEVAQVGSYNPDRPQPDCIESDPSWTVAPIQPVLAGTHLYTTTQNAGTLVLDVSTPKSPNLVEQVSPQALDMVAVGDGLLAGSVNEGQWADGKDRVYLYALGADGTTGAAPVGQLDAAGWVTGVALKGKTLLVTDVATGLSAYDVSDPTQPRLEATLPVGHFAYRIVLDGDRAYLADVLNGLAVVDVSAPAQPKLVGTFPDVKEWEVAVRGSQAYLPASPVKVLDVGHPTVVQAPPPHVAPTGRDWLREMKGFCLSDMIYNPGGRQLRLQLTCNKVRKYWQAAGSEKTVLPSTAAVGYRFGSLGFATPYTTEAVPADGVTVDCPVFQEMEQRVSNVDTQLECVDIYQIEDLKQFCNAFVDARLAQDPSLAEDVPTGVRRNACVDGVPGAKAQGR